MRLFGLCALALAAESAYGYLDTTPFFMFSTSELLTSSSELRSASSVVSDVGLSLSQCPSDYYLLVSQHGVSGSDYQSIKSTPALAKSLSGRHPRVGVRSSMAVPDVQGVLTPSTWIANLQDKCGVEVTEIDASQGSIPTTLTPTPRLIKVDLPAPSSNPRAKDLSSNDAFFASILDLLPTQNYTVLYTTTRAAGGSVGAQQHEQTEYGMDSSIQESLHLDLKRDLGAHAANRTGNQTLVDGPLFDKYQFFTPGIYVSLLVGIILLSILYVAISAISSLQVTYAAFDKETGALAGKKQQQG